VPTYPAIGDRVELIGPEELSLIFGSGCRHSIRIGHITQNAAIAAHVNTDHLLTKHLSIAGATGVGKSAAAASIRAA